LTVKSFLEEQHRSFRKYENVHSSVCHCSCGWLYISFWFGLFVHPFSHICNIGHVSYRLQFTTHLV